MRNNFRKRNVEVKPASEEKEKSVESGFVTGCSRLNVRKEPNVKADVLSVIPANSEVMVELDGSTDDFYKVCTSVGIEGFCMKKYISLKR